MKIAQKYSHLNGEEFLIVHHNSLYEEIKKVIAGIDCEIARTKKSKERNKKDSLLYSPIDLNNAFKKEFRKLGWEESKYNYYITLNRELMEKSLSMSLKEQKKFLKENGKSIKEPLHSYKQTDFVKDKIAIEVQFGKYPFVAYDLFVKHMLFYSGRVIDLGIEILPTKRMQNGMSSGIGYYEGEVYNVMRHGRGNPPVPLVILGIEP